MRSEIYVQYFALTSTGWRLQTKSQIIRAVFYFLPFYLILFDWDLYLSPPAASVSFTAILFINRFATQFAINFFIVKVLAYITNLQIKRLKELLLKINVWKNIWFQYLSIPSCLFIIWYLIVFHARKLNEVSD